MSFKKIAKNVIKIKKCNSKIDSLLGIQFVIDVACDQSVYPADRRSRNGV